MKPQKNVKTTWSAELSYCIGLIASDGSLSKDGRHIIFVSKDLEQVKTFAKCLNLSNKIGCYPNGSKIKKYHYKIQFGDVNFYRFLLSIGLSPNKSKTIGALSIPPEFIPDFLRGSFDGDGTFYSYFDKRWRSSFMYYLCFISASLTHIEWIQSITYYYLGLTGYISYGDKNHIYQLRYAKKEAQKIINSIYYNPDVPKLERKYLKVYNALATDARNHSARVL